MALSSSSSKHLLKQYHRLAEDTLLGGKIRNDSMVLEAAEDGRLDKLTSLLDTSPDCVNARCPSSGDTPLIIAARSGYKDVAKLLLKQGADITVQNDLDETAIDVASEDMRKIILEYIHHEDRSMSNAQALLQSAWLGDAVSLRKCVESGRNYLDVNCQNTDGLTPVLLVTRDISLFEKIQNAMETNYDPIGTMNDLIKNNANLDSCDQRGRSAMHLVASSASVHAKKMASVLLRNGASADVQDYDKYSPLHVACGEGHTAIIVALVEEGGVDVNTRGGETGDTPLIMSARGGHDEAAKYLLSQGADVTALDYSGNDALSVAKSPSMLGILKEAWVEQTKSDHSSSSVSSRSHSPCPSPTQVSDEGSIQGTSGANSLSSSGNRGTSPLPLLLDDVQNLLLNESHPSPHPFSQDELFFVTEGKFTPFSQTSEDVTDSSIPAPLSPLSPAHSSTAQSSPAHSSMNQSSPAHSSMNQSSSAHSSMTQSSPAHSRANVQRQSRDEPDGPVVQHDLNTNKAAGNTTKEEGHTKGRGSKTTRSKILTKNVSDKDLRREKKKSSKRLKTKSESEGQLSVTPTHEKPLQHSSLSDNTRPHPSKKNVRSRQVTGQRMTPLNPPKLDRILSRSSEHLLDGRTGERGMRGVKGGTSSSASDLLYDRNKLPPVTAAAQHHSQQPTVKTSLPSPLKTHQRLPSLTNMQPVAFIAVDTEQENLKLQKFPSSRIKNNILSVDGTKLSGGGVASPKSARVMDKGKQSPSMQRSFSLNIRDSQGRLVDQTYGGHSKKRNSVGAVAVANVRGHQLSQQQPQQQDSKVPFLPKLITPQFGVGVVGLSTRPSTNTPASLNNTQGSVTSQARLPGYARAGKPLTTPLTPPHVSIEEEEDTLTGSSHHITSDSTLKELNYYQTDSLEPSPGTHPSDDGPAPDAPSGHAQSNLMVSYARLPTSAQGSPIWKPRLLFEDDTDTTSSQFISSPIGELGAFPSNLLPGNRLNDTQDKNIPSFISHSRSGSETEGGAFRPGRRGSEASSSHSRQGSDISGKSVHGSDAGSHSRRGSDAGWHSRHGSDAGWHSRRGSDAGWHSRRGSDAGHHDETHGRRQRNSHSEGGSSGEDIDDSREEAIVWKKGKMLGKGAYGKVWEGLLSSARMVAVKEVELDTGNLERAKSQYSKIQAEVGILKSLSHRNIVRYLGTSMQDATVYIFMNYISGGSIQSMLKRFGSLSCDTVIHYTRQIASALYYLHGNGIIHRDIKGANVMVDPKGTVKLIDFGCAKNCEDLPAMHSVRGTPYWMAPEVICGLGYGKKSDIWSLGCTVQEMATTKPPWGEFVPEAAMFQIGMGNPIPKLPDNLDHELKDFIYFCLTRNQTERPGAADVLNHKFLK